MGNKEYKTPEEVKQRAEEAIGHSFKEIFELAQKFQQENGLKEKHGKGDIGQAYEEGWFNYACNEEAEPDFKDADIELKVTSFLINSRGYRAKERLSLGKINYKDENWNEYEESRFWTKNHHLLVMYYQYIRGVKREEFSVEKVDEILLKELPERDQMIIQHDWEKIARYVKAGKAHELSEGDTLYLGAATKAATSEDRREQPFSDELAKPRAFAFKNSYMTYVLNNYIVPGKKTYESIVEGNIEESFEDYVVKKIDEHCGSSELELCYKYEVNIDKKPKDLGAILAYRMLGIKSNKAEEFVKANVVVKTIRVENNNKIKEHMSFPIFRFKELVEEDWENSTFGNYLRETRFLFVVYKFDENGELRLRGAQFWNMPYEDLEGNVRKVWKETKQILIDGLEVEKVNGKNYNNFPKASDNPICHVRPHARNAQDVDELPDGRMFPKQCFWLNKEYILSQLDENFLEE